MRTRPNLISSPGEKTTNREEKKTISICTFKDQSIFLQVSFVSDKDAINDYVVKTLGFQRTDFRYFWPLENVRG